MKTEEVLSFYGSKTKVAEALKISLAAVSQWGDQVPPLRAYQLERLSDGKLKAEPAPERAA
jgi:DNA-binding transcriptional regulator YdaS (Cro superfamily)